MSSFSELMAALGGGSTIDVSADWLQGRTAYGGLTAGLSVEAARRSMEGEAPLRSGQVAFMGPASGALTVTPTVLRSGKSATYVGVDVVGDAGPAVRSLFCFGAERLSAISHGAIPMPPVPAPDACAAYFGPDRAPGFSGQFDIRLAAGARPMTPGAEPTFAAWVRHRDVAAHASVAGLVALADAIPPAAFILYPSPAPFSTATWAFDVLSAAPVSRDAWWLVQSRADTARGGYSAQSMTIWNSAGEAVILARQTVAVFA